MEQNFLEQLSYDFEYTLAIIQNKKNNIVHIEMIERCVNQFRKKYSKLENEEVIEISKLQEAVSILQWELSKLKEEMENRVPTIEELINQEPNNYSLGEIVRSLYGKKY